MAKTYEYNNVTGVFYEMEDTSDGGLIIRTMQDVQPHLEYTNAKRNSGVADRGIKEDWWHYAHIPTAVWLKMKADYGIDVFDRNHEKDVFKYINREIPYLKTTNLKHE